MKKLHRQSKYFKILTKDFLYKEYIVNKKSTRKIAEEFKISKSAIWVACKKHSISMRILHCLNSILTKSFLYKEYIVNKKSCKTIAQEAGCGIVTVWKHLKINKIPRRPAAPRRGKYNHNYVDGRYNKKYYCIDCLKKGIKTEISVCSGVYGGYRCRKHSMIYLYKNQIHPRYIKGLIRKYPYKFNEILKASIRERDNHRCQICGKSTKKNGRKLDVHHIDYDKANLNPENLISLCRSCHGNTSGIINFNREIYIEFFKILRGVIYD